MQCISRSTGPSRTSFLLLKRHNPSLSCSSLSPLIPSSLYPPPPSRTDPTPPLPSPPTPPATTVILSHTRKTKRNHMRGISICYYFYHSTYAKKVFTFGYLKITFYPIFQQRRRLCHPPQPFSHPNFSPNASLCLRLFVPV